MTSFLRKTGFVVGLLLVAVGVLPLAHAQEKIVLKVSDSFAPTHYIPVQGLLPWMARVKELTGGKVEFQYFGAEQLGPLRDQFNLVQRDVADIAYLPPAFNLGKMPLSGVSGLPKLFSSSVVGSAAFWDTIHETSILQNDYLKNGFRPLWGVMTSTYNVFTKDKPVRSLADLKGLKLKSIGGNMASAVKLLGAVPVDVPSPDTYQAIQTGTVDGAVFPTTSLYSYRLNEQTKYATFGFDLFVFYAAFVINERVWQKLPEDVRKALLQAGQEASVRVAKYTDDDNRQLEQKLAADGINVVTLSTQEQDQLVRLIEPVHQSWLKEMAGKGLPGEEALANFKKNIAKRQ